MFPLRRGGRGRPARARTQSPITTGSAEFQAAWREGPLDTRNTLGIMLQLNPDPAAGATPHQATV